MTVDTSSLTGKMIGRHEIREVIGRGGMATVYKAYHLDLEREVALKIIANHHLSEQFLKRFEREAKTAGQLQHPHILPVFEHGMLEGVPYIITAYMDGGTLASLKQNGFMPVDDLVHYIKQIANALDYAHTKQIIHRDIKPANILLDRAGNAFLADFGLVKVHEATLNLTGSAVVGTPHYMAPEVVIDEETVSPAVDIYALGVTVFELLTTTFPYTGDTPLKVIMNHINEPVPDLLEIRPDLPVELSDAVSKAMAKEPEQRPPTAMAFAQAIEKSILESTGVGIKNSQEKHRGESIGRNATTAANSAPFKFPLPALIATVAAILVGLGLLVSTGAIGLPRLAQAEVVEPYITAGGNASGVSGVSLSSDGSLCAAAGVDNQILIWDANTGERTQALQGHEGIPQAVTFSPDGELVASGSTTAEIILWSVVSGETLQTLEGHDDAITSLVFSSDGSQLLSGSLDGLVNIWDMQSNNILQSIATGFPVHSADFSPDTMSIAIAASNNIVTVWDIESGDLLQELVGHQASLQSVSFSPDGSLLASTSEDGSIILWDWSNGVVINEFSPTEEALSAVIFSPDGETLIAGGANGQAIEVSAETGATQRQFDVDDRDVVSMAISKNAEVIAASTADGEIFMFR